MMEINIDELQEFIWQHAEHSEQGFHKDRFDAVAKALRELQSLREESERLRGWVSVDDKLPPRPCGVIAAIVRDEESYESSEMYFNGDRFVAPWEQLDKEEIYHGEVHFWRPLPKPPEHPGEL